MKLLQHYFKMMEGSQLLLGPAHLLLSNCATIFRAMLKHVVNIFVQKKRNCIRIIRLNLEHFFYLESGKTEMRWSAIRLSGSPILTSKNDSCLIVPERGTYGVFSVLTFSINKEDNVTKLAHFMQLKGCQEDEMPFQRKLFAVPVPENRQVTEVIPSSLVSFVAMEANGRICIYTADKLQKYLYVSRLDNTVNIFKV